MKILAVDYGEARTGLASCDPDEILVTPITPQIEEKSLNKAVAKVCEKALEIGASRILLGLPLNMDGTEGPRAKKSRKIQAMLEAGSGLPVVLWDERRTTVSAAAILADNATFGKKRKERLDSVSAAVLLESYLAYRRHHPEET